MVNSERIYKEKKKINSRLPFRIAENILNHSKFYVTRLHDKYGRSNTFTPIYSLIFYLFSFFDFHIQPTEGISFSYFCYVLLVNVSRYKIVSCIKQHFFFPFSSVLWKKRKNVKENMEWMVIVRLSHTALKSNQI